MGAGPVAASGPGWTCTGTATSRCTRSRRARRPAPRYPPITVTVGRGQRRRGTCADGDGRGRRRRGGSATDDIPVAADACPNGWAATRSTRARGRLHAARPRVGGEPFADQAAFEAQVRTVAAQFAGADATR